LKNAPLRLSAVLCVILSGCGVIPPQVSVQDYGDANASSQEFGYVFRHRRSVLKIKYEGGNFKAEAAPYELNNKGEFLPLYKISGIEDIRANTQLKVSYLDNTKLIDKIDITTKDNLAETINKIGSVAAAVAPLVAGVVSQSDAATIAFKATVVDPADLIEMPGKWTQDETNPDYCVMLSDIQTEKGLKLETYIKNRANVKGVDFPVPSCSTAVLKIVQCNAKDTATAATMRVTFASTDTVTPIPLPSSGSLKMNSVCGASVTEADNQDRTDLKTYLTNLITQVNNIKAAFKKK
jgi:hypothetical protein